MKNVIPTALLFVAAAAMLNVAGQTKTSVLPYERMFLETVMKDTSSRATCYLKGLFLFNMEERSFGQFVMLKNGRRNLFVREATGQVYEARQTPVGPLLVRLDSNEQIGDNFRMLAFERNDTLYQYGGYGFWRTRDFFTRYDPSKGDWQFVPSENTLPAEYRMHYYDRSEDALYMLGDALTDSHLYDTYAASDSVYRYHFSDRTWRPIGVMRPEHANQSKVKFQAAPHSFVQTEFGILQLEDIPSLVDFKGNRVMRPEQRLFDRLRLVLNGMYSSLLHQSVIFHLRDSLHAIITREGKVEHLAIPLKREDFDTSTAVPFYDALEKPKEPLRWWASLIAAGSAAGVAAYRLMVIRKRRKRPDTEAGQNSPRSGHPAGDVTGSGVANDPSDARMDGLSSKAGRFLASLSATERDFTKRLLLMSLQGKSMEIETFNKILGVAVKEEGVRKTRRSLTVSNVNEAFSLTMHVKGELVVRERDGADRRSYRYRIAEEHLSILQEVFGFENGRGEGQTM